MSTYLNETQIVFFTETTFPIRNTKSNQGTENHRNSNKPTQKPK